MKEDGGWKEGDRHGKEREKEERFGKPEISLKASN